MKRPLLFTTTLLCCFAFFSCMKKKEAPEYKFVSLELENGAADEKFPRLSNTSVIDAGVFCIHTQLNLEPKIITDYGFDTRKPMVNKTPIDSVIITSDVDFNSVFLAGDNLSSLFRIFRKDYYSIINLVDFKPTDFTEKTDYYDGPFNFKRYLLLAERPTVLGSRKFYVKVISGIQSYSDSVEVNLF